MARRIHIPSLGIGDNPLDSAQAHHARDVLRLTDGAAVEVFDDAGATAAGVLIYGHAGSLAVRVERLDPVSEVVESLQWVVAAAVPKGERADWMVEKLSELGAAGFIPLAASRSVVLPEGKGKRERWMRIATESAKQSRRKGVMRIEELTPIDVAVRKAGGSPAWFLATEVPGISIGEAVASARNFSSLTIFVGPEGGWTDQEIACFNAAAVPAIRLTTSILRIETAAIAAGAVVATLLGNRSRE